MPIYKGTLKTGAAYKGNVSLSRIYKGAYLVFEAFKTLIAEGVPPLTLLNCAAEIMLGYRIYGNSIQDGTPTPSNPIEIESVGDKTKNLLSFSERTITTDTSTIPGTGSGNTVKRQFDYDKIYLGLTVNNYQGPGYIQDISMDNHSITFRVTGAGYGVGFPMKLKPSTQYSSGMYIKSGVGAMSASAVFYAEDGTYIRSADIASYTNSADNVYKTGTFTTPENCTTAVILLKLATGSMTGTATFSDIMIVEGSYTANTMLQYEPYGYKIPLTVTGKNLFDIDKYIYNLTADSKISKVNDQTLRVQNRSYQENYNLFEMNYKLNTRYTLSFEYEWETASLNQSGFKVRAIYTDGTYSDLNSINDVKPSVANQTGKIVATSAENKTISKIVIGYWQGSGIVLIKNIQLEEGTEETDYEAYVTPRTANIYLNEPLRKIGDYADYIDFETEKVVRVTNEYQITGQEQNLYIYDSNKGLRFLKSDMKSGRNQDGLSNRYINYKNLAPIGSPKITFGDSNNYIYIREFYGDGNTTTIEAIKQTLQTWYTSGVPLTVTYLLTTSEEESIELPDILLNKGTNIISVGTSVQPSNMWIKYKGKA